MKRITFIFPVFILLISCSTGNLLLMDHQKAVSSLNKTDSSMLIQNSNRFLANNSSTNIESPNFAQRSRTSKFELKKFGLSQNKNLQNQKILKSEILDSISFRAKSNEINFRMIHFGDLTFELIKKGKLITIVSMLNNHRFILKVMLDINFCWLSKIGIYYYTEIFMVKPK